LSHLLKNLGYLQLEATPIYEDNQACIKNAKDDMVQAQTKHINIRYDFSRQAVKSGEVKLIYCPTEVMLADALTKALCEVKFAKFVKSIKRHDSIRTGMFKTKPVLLDSAQSSARKLKASTKLWINPRKQELIQMPRNNTRIHSLKSRSNHNGSDKPF
jgi:hypothetical protein